VIVDEIQRDTAVDSYEISARLRPEGSGLHEVPRVWFRFPREYAPDGDLDASPFLAATLVWCLRHREDLFVDGPVSPSLLDEVEEITAVLRSFFPSAIRPVAVRAAAKQEPTPGRELTASLFTRGLDSWFTLLVAREDPQLQPPLTHTVYCPTFNAKGWRDELREAKLQAVRAASARAGLQLIQLETNVNRLAGHGQFAMALALGFANLLISSGDMRGGLIPRGLHPDLDPRFSTTRTRIVHYGDASRIQKAQRVARSQSALDTLDVCQYDYLEQDRNCGRCEKCLRTMLELHALGALDRCPVFDEPLRVANVAQIDNVRGSRQAWLEAQHALGDSEFDRELAAAVRMVIFRSDLRFAAHRAKTLSVREDLGQALRDESLLAETAERLWAADHDVEQRMSALTGKEESRGSGRRRARRGRVGHLVSRLLGSSRAGRE
jgi:hypothetical protein